MTTEQNGRVAQSRSRIRSRDARDETQGRPPDTELEEFFDLSVDPLSIIGFDGEFKRVNAAFLGLSGYTKPELFSRTALGILHPDDVEPAREALAQLAEGHGVVAFEARVVRSDGAVRWLEWNARSMPERGVVYSVGRDTTDRRCVDDDLREAQRLLEASRDELALLAEEQAALRRVATLVARDVPQDELCVAVMREAGALMGADFSGLLRFDDGGTATTVATWAATGEHPPVPERWPIEPGDAMTMIMGTGEPARVDDWAAIPGRLAEFIHHEMGVRSSVGCSILVGGQVWGGLAVHSKQPAPLAADTEASLHRFADLVATAIANRDARAEVTRLAQEQAALRRVATLVARGTGPESVFRAVADEVGTIMGCDTAAIVRFEADGWATVMGAHQSRRRPGARFEPEPGHIVASVRSTGHATRFDTDDPAAAEMPDVVRAAGIRSGVAAPIVVDGELWGTITVASLHGSLPVSTERRLADFTELVATAISNTQAREELRQLADTQGALRRVATLVAREASQAEVFTAIAEECAALFGVEETRMMRFEASPSELVVVAGSGGPTDLFPVGSHHPLRGENAATRVFRTGRPARVDDFSTTALGQIGAASRSAGIRSAVSTPIMVAGRLWGALSMGTYGDPLPAYTESRIADFTELMATAIANTESRATADRLADEQAALRRLATLVAQEAPLEAVFAKVAEEVARTVGSVDSALWRDDGDRTVTAVAVRGPSDAPGVSVGTQLSLDGDSVIAEVLREGRPHRVDDYSLLAGSIAERARELGMRSAVGCPIVVGTRAWGAMTVATYEAEPLAPGTETRVARFSDLVATAIANAEARAEVERLAHEQAALRRVATLVAQGTPSDALLGAVCDEVEALAGADASAVIRFEADSTVTLVGANNATRHSVGARLELDPDYVVAEVHRTGRAARLDTDDPAAPGMSEVVREERVRSAVASPIVVEGELWGAITTASRERPLLAGTERRLADFTELVATAIANVQARAEVERLAAEQAALRRVATLVAAGAEPAAVFDAVAAEMEALLGADQVSLGRYEPGNEVTVVAHRGTGASRLPPGSRLGLQGESVTTTVRRTKRPARIEDFERADGPIAAIVRAMGMRVSVGAPIIVDGGLWGVITARWAGKESLPGDTEERMARFAELLDSAIANADSRNQLTASRARLVAAGDEARRRVVRDLHDGAQQGLVHTIVALKLAKRALRQQDGRAESRLAEALGHAERSNEDLRELAHGILPAVLTRGGLPAGVRALTSRLQLPVELELASERVQADVEASAYFMVAEALTNVVKHAHASQASVRTSVADGALRVEVTDDGIGGADPTGHGLVGMVDRVTALGGRLEIATPPAGGTRVTATFPLPVAA
jgi:PAS domain S-box-containing protein